MIAGLHILILYDFYRTVMFGEKLHWKTKVFIVGFVAFIVFAWVLPKKADKLIVDTKAAISAYDKSKQEDTNTAVQERQGIQRVVWRPDVIADNPLVYTVLPKIPAGVRFDVYCEGGKMRVFSGHEPKKSRDLECGEEIGQNIQNLEIGVRPLTKDNPITVTVKLTY